MDKRYNNLLSRLPLGVQEQDWSAIKIAIDQLRSDGIEDLFGYFKSNPLILKDLVKQIKITDVNPALLKLYETESIEEYIEDEENPDNWWTAEWANLYASEFTALASPDRIHYRELKEHRVDGTPFETRLITSISRDENDDWSSVLTLVEDVTERKQNEIALIEAKKIAEQASQAKSEFLSTMSHEIRTPMNGVLGMTEMLMDSDLNGHCLRLATIAHRSAVSLLDTINDILDFSKIEAGKMELVGDDFNLREDLEEVLEMIAEQAHRKNLECVANISPEIPEMVNGDANRLRQVLINLLGNAVKFTEQGEIQLEVRIRRQSAEFHHIEIDISDTGPGIPPEKKHSIFDAFSQVDLSASRSAEGTGLGLAISRQLIELMGGRLELLDTSGIGAVFRLDLTLAVAKDGSNRPKPHPEKLTGLRVLAVDDHEVNREILLNQLTSWGLRCDSVESSSKALDYLSQAQTENDPYQVVLLDRIMPDVDGFELAKKISADPNLQTPKLVLLSSAGFDIPYKNRGESAINHYLQKPVKQQILMDCLCKVVDADYLDSNDLVKQKHQFEGSILIAEDNQVNQEVALGMLLKLGLDAELARDGKEVLSAAKARRYDLILMDCHMPEMDGFCASKKIREYETQNELPRTPILALTANVNKGVEDECTEAGMDGYLSKPFTQKSLVALLARWLETKDPAGKSDKTDKSEVKAIEAKEKVLDSEVIHELRNLSVDTGRDILGKSANFFLQQTPKDVDELRRASSQSDLDALRLTAHSLKSSSANLGAIEFSKECHRLEIAARDGELAEANQLLNEIEELLPCVLTALRQEIDQDSESEEELSSGILVRRDASNPTILVVDDDISFRLTTCEALKATGFNVIEASSGEEALAILDNTLPDLFLLDGIMPVIDGFELCKLIRERRNTRNTPVIMLTGLGDTESVNKALDSGATGFIDKPVNYAVLSSHILFQLHVAKDFKELQISQGWLTSVQRISGIGYWQWNSSTDEMAVSEQLAEMLAPNSTLNISNLNDFLEFINPEDRELVREKILSVSQQDTTSSDDYRLFTTKSDNLIVHQELARPRDSDEIVLGTIQDVTHQRESEKRIRELAYSDSLTGLASRAYFHRHLEEVIKASQRRSERFALLYLDLDGFKDINDSLGHDVGDVLLNKIAQRLKRAIRDIDFVARLGGDEFCIIADNICDQYDAVHVADRCLELMNEPVILKQQKLQPRCSIGIAYYPDDGEDTQSLLKAADSAMYAAKESGKHKYVCYQPEFTVLAEKRLQLEYDLRLSIDRDELEVYYQPQIELQTGRIIGLEALVRWNHPVRGMISPLEFIDIAEQIGFINTLGQWVLQAACQQAVSWSKMGISDIQMAVNISPSHFLDPGFVEIVKQTLVETEFPSSSLELEVTESVAQPTEENLSIFHNLKELGVSIAIDDFGTGYSSLASLKHLPIDHLKIDRIFIVDMLEDQKSSILLGTIVGMAQALGQTVVAEGVEELDQVMVLKALGCDVIQGYYFSKPVPAHEIPKMAHTGFLKKLKCSDNTFPAHRVNAS